jgi:hypothetical protein
MQKSLKIQFSFTLATQATAAHLAVVSRSFTTKRQTKNEGKVCSPAATNKKQKECTIPVGRVAHNVFVHMPCLI